MNKNKKVANDKCFTENGSKSELTGEFLWYWKLEAW